MVRSRHLYLGVWEFRAPDGGAHRKEHPLRRVIKLASLTLVGAVALGIVVVIYSCSSTYGNSGA